ncbi:MAG: hypothetical protein IKI77_08840 [Oscillospiraceae bacterium]|nr:hypothetical protein [Oscillospiraceae bacterium]
MMKNTEMLEWMSGLDPRYLEESEQPLIRQHKIRRRIPALIAAAAAVLCLTAGVSAYIRYNKPMVQFGFGTIGEARMAELAAPQPVTYDNGSMSITVENVLSDGIQGMLLLTLEPVDKSQPYDWSDFDDHIHTYMWNEFVCGDTRRDTRIAIDTMDGCREQQNAAGQRWFTLYIKLPEDAAAEELANASLNCIRHTVEGNGSSYTYGELFSGISIPLDLRQNVDSVQMRAEDGTELTLSAFELYQYGVQAGNNEWWNMYVTWKNGKEQRITYGSMAGSDSGAVGTESWGGFDIPTDAEISNATGSYQRSSPEDWYGFLDVNDVSAFRFGDRTYYPVES